MVAVEIIENSEIHRMWLQTELAFCKEINLLGVNRFGRDGIEFTKNNHTDLVLLDFQLEDMTGLEVAKRIKMFNQNIKIFILTAHREISIIKRLIYDKNIDAIALKGSPYFEESFVSAITKVANGDAYVDPSVLEILRKSDSDNSLSKLTKREFEIFIQANTGKTDLRIATDLCVEVSHVRNIKSKIFKKVKQNDLDKVKSKISANVHPDSSILVCL